MKKSIGLILGILVSVSVVVASGSKGEKIAYEVDNDASKVYWTGKKITGSSHTGYLYIEKGEVMVENDKVTGAMINMDLNSIVCTDLENESYNKKLVGHLKSDDFFSVEKFPTARFEISSIKPSASGNYDVEGKLTMKGETHTISFPAVVDMVNGKVSAKGTALIDRTKWGIKYGSGSFFKGLGDNMINDEFEIKFEILATENSSTVLED
jgi:polyisoprenoid-binding protein YceI